MLLESAIACPKIGQPLRTKICRTIKLTVEVRRSGAMLLRQLLIKDQALNFVAYEGVDIVQAFEGGGIQVQRLDDFHWAVVSLATSGYAEPNETRQRSLTQ